MCTAVENIHHRYGQNVRLQTAEEPIEGNILGLCCGIRCSNRHGKDGIGTELGLIFGAVNVKHRLIYCINIACLNPKERRGNLCIDILDSLRDPFAAELRLVSITQLQCLKLPRRCTGRRCTAANRAVLQDNLRLDCRISTRVNDFTANNSSNS